MAGDYSQNLNKGYITENTWFPETIDGLWSTLPGLKCRLDVPGAGCSRQKN